MAEEYELFAREACCDVTTTGRVSGRPHMIEIWFALNGKTLYMLSGGMERSDWVKNALRQPTVTIKIKETVFSGQARLVHAPEEDSLARRLIGEKYQPTEEEDLEEWLTSALPVAVDLVM